MTASHSTYIEGPRWAGLRKALVQIAHLTDVTLVVDSVDKGLIRETIFYTIRGTREQRLKFEQILIESLEAYNRG